MSRWSRFTATLVATMVIATTAPARGDLVASPPPLDEALTRADAAVTGVLRSVSTGAARTGPSESRAIFTVAVDRVLIGRARPHAVLSFDLRHFSWPTELVPFAAGQRCTLLLRDGDVPELIAALPPLPAAAGALDRTELRSALLEAGYAKLQALSTRASALEPFAAALSRTRLVDLRQAHPDWQPIVDEVLDRRTVERIRVLSDAGNFREAEGALGELFRPEAVDDGLARLVEGHKIRGQLDEARVLVARMRDPVARGRALASIAAAASDPDRARRLIDELLTFYGGIPRDARIDLAPGIADLLSRTHRATTGRTMLQEAANDARGSAHLAEIITTQVSLGFVDDALATIESMHDDPYNQVVRLTSAAEYLARSARLDDAARFVALARPIAARIEPSNRATYLEQISSAQSTIETARKVKHP